MHYETRYVRGEAVFPSSAGLVRHGVKHIRVGMDERVREIRNAVEIMIARLDLQLKTKLLALMAHKNEFMLEMKRLENLLAKIDRYLNVKPRSELITKSPGELSIITMLI